MTKPKRVIKNVLWIASGLIAGGALATVCPVGRMKIMEHDFVATTLGVILGFGLTIYTFIMQLIAPIIVHISKGPEEEIEKKARASLLLSAELELRDDLRIILSSFIIVIGIGVLDTSYKMDFYVAFFDRQFDRIPQATYFASYLFSLRALYDLMRSLFVMGGILTFILHSEVIKKDPPAQESEPNS